MSSLQENQFQNSNTINLNDLDDKITYLNEQLLLREKNEQEMVEEQLVKKKQVFAEKKLEKQNLLGKQLERIAELEHIYNKEWAKEARRIEKLKNKQKNTEKEQSEQIKAVAVQMEAEQQALVIHFEEKYREKEAEKKKLEDVF